MCELNARITAWRDTLAARLSGAELAELEDHLRETLGGLPETSLSPDEQFLIATRRLGAPGAIVAEFEKADPARVWQSRVLWMLMGWAGVGLVSGLGGWLATGVAMTMLILGGSANLLVVGIVGTRVVAVLLAVWFVVALAQGKDRGARVVAGRAARLPGVVKGLGVVAAALALLGFPIGLVFAALQSTISPGEWNQYVYAQNLAYSSFHIAQTLGLFAAMLWLAGRQRRRVAPAVGSGGSG